MGNTFEVNLDVQYEGKKKIKQLADTLNYEDLYGIVKNEMEKPTDLLENIAEGIIQQIKKQFPRVREISVEVFKLQAPIAHFQGKTGITLSKKYGK